MVSSVVTRSELGILHFSALFGPELSAQHFSALTGPELDTPGTGVYGDQVLKTAKEGPTVRFDAGVKMPEQMSSGSGSCQAWLPALQRNTRAVPVGGGGDVSLIGLTGWAGRWEISENNGVSSSGSELSSDDSRICCFLAGDITSKICGIEWISELAACNGTNTRKVQKSNDC